MGGPAVAISALAVLLAGLYPVLHPNTVVKWMDVPVEVLLGLYIPLSILPSMALSYHSESLSFLPARRLYLEGKGWLVVGWWLSATALSLIAAVFLLPLAVEVHESLYPYHQVLLWAFVAVMLYARGWGKALLFSLYGILGTVVLFHLPLKDPLFLLFSGFFALPALAGLGEGTSLPMGGGGRPTVGALLLSLLGAGLASLFLALPGVGSPSAALGFVALFMPLDSWAYLSVNGGYLAAQLPFALTIKEELGIARIGSVIGTKEWDVELFLISFAVGSVLTGALYPFLEKLYRKEVQALLLAGVVAYVGVEEGLLGLAVLLTAGALGYLHRLKGGSAFPFFGSLVVPVLLRGIL